MTDRADVSDRVAETGGGAVALGIVDIVGSGNWLSDLGDERYGALLDDIKDLWSDAIWSLGGVVVSDTGDGCIYIHESVDGAIAIGARMHRALIQLPKPERVETRHGVHHGSISLARYGYCGAGIYEVVDLGDVATSSHLWLSESAVAQATRPTGGAWREVDLSRSGRVVVREIDLRCPLEQADASPSLTIAV